jgi:hypothetical protein
MARMRRKFADVIANQRRGLGSIERNRSPRTTRNISPIGRIVDYEQGKGGRDMSMLPSPIERMPYDIFGPGIQSDTPMLPDTITPDPSEERKIKNLEMYRNFFMEPGYEPSPITTPVIPPDYVISPMEPYGDDGAYDTTRGDSGYEVGLNTFNKDALDMYNPRQEGLDYTPPMQQPQPRPSWDNSVGNYLRKIAAAARLFNRGGIASLRR